MAKKKIRGQALASPGDRIGHKPIQSKSDRYDMAQDDYSAFEAKPAKQAREAGRKNRL